MDVRRRKLKQQTANSSRVPRAPWRATGLPQAAPNPVPNGHKGRWMEWHAPLSVQRVLVWLHFRLTLDPGLRALVEVIVVGVERRAARRRRWDRKTRPAVRRRARGSAAAHGRSKRLLHPALRAATSAGDLALHHLWATARSWAGEGGRVGGMGAPGGAGRRRARAGAVARFRLCTDRTDERPAVHSRGCGPRSRRCLRCSGRSCSRRSSSSSSPAASAGSPS